MSQELKELTKKSESDQKALTDKLSEAQRALALQSVRDGASETTSQSKLNDQIDELT